MVSLPWVRLKRGSQCGGWFAWGVESGDELFVRVVIALEYGLIEQSLLGCAPGRFKNKLGPVLTAGLGRPIDQPPIFRANSQVKRRGSTL